MAEERKGYTLYVKNLPAELNENGIRQVFNPYGEITGFFHRGDPSGDSWAYISYATYAEAERAIEDLHDKCPLYLMVTFAKIKGAQKPPRASSSHSSSDSSSINNPHKQNNRRSSLSQQRAPYKKDGSQTDLNAATKQLRETRLEDNGLDGKLTKYVDPNDNTNTLWSRQKVTVTEDGRRHVSHGRGYTLYEITKPMPTVDNLVDTVHSRMLRHGTNKLAPLMGRCEHCSKQAAFTCKECGAFYCDERCQANDSSRHSTRCNATVKTTTSPPSNTEPSLGGKLVRPTNRKSDDLNIKPLMSQSRPTQNQEQKPKMTNKWDSEVQPPLPRPKATPEKPSPKAANQMQKLREPAIDASNMQAAKDPDCSSDSRMNHFTVTAELTANLYKVTISPGAQPDEDINTDEYLERLLTRIQQRCEQTKPPSNFKPSKVDLVCGRKDGRWLRGYMTALVPCLRMYAIDEGEFVVVDKVQPCPKEYAIMDGVCILSDAGVKLPRAKISYTTSKTCFIGDDKKQIVLSIHVHLNDSEHRTPITATLRPSSAERRAFRYTKLKDGSTVCVTSYRGPVKLFVRSLEPSKVEHFNRLMQNAARFALTASPLKEASVGGMVLARYIDGNYYRAIVVSKGETDELIKIFYTDFGNTETAKLSDLRVMPTELKGYDSCMTPVILKNVANDACATKECNDYLVSLTVNEVPLVCKVHSADGSLVSLKTSDGEDVSDSVNKSITPSWKEKNDDDKRCYELKDMDSEKLGEIGDTVPAVILSMDYATGLCYVCTADTTLITHISTTLNNSIKKYFASSDYYIPREEEACLIVHDGKGSRAICLQREADSCTVFLLDTAKMLKIKHQDIRYMPKDFLHPGCLANMCEIADLAPKDQDGRYSRAVQGRLEELIPAGETLTAKIVNYDEDGQTYTVKLPDIHRQLVDEGLVSS